MAYDKVVDSAVLDAGLKTIADAIREKGGTSGNLAFPTAMAEAIAAIEAGGGSVIVETGSVTLTSSVSYHAVTTSANPGVRPDIFAWFVTPESTKTITNFYANSYLRAELVILKEVVADTTVEADGYSFGYFSGTKSMNMPYVVKNTTIHGTSDYYCRINRTADQADLEGAVSYKWIAIWGATV